MEIVHDIYSHIEKRFCIYSYISVKNCALYHIHKLKQVDKLTSRIKYSQNLLEYGKYLCFSNSFLNTFLSIFSIIKLSGITKDLDLAGSEKQALFLFQTASWIFVLFSFIVVCFVFLNLRNKILLKHRKLKGQMI